ncbi:MAG: hypothetical protein ACKVQT_34330 [Burkholderiales bacterium]
MITSTNDPQQVRRLLDETKHTAPSGAAGAAQGAPLGVSPGLLDRAKAGDAEAIITMFQQFVPPNEEIRFVDYLGLQGLWGFGTHSFACLTDRRIASLRVGGFGEVIYQDGYLEYLNSGVIYQPSLFSLYLAAIGFGIFVLMFAIATFGLGLLLIALTPLLVKMYYRMNKCGLVWWIREGVSVYVFANRAKLTLVNRVYRLSTKARDERIRMVGQS